MIRYWIQILLVVLLGCAQTACPKWQTIREEKPKLDFPFKPADEFMDVG